MQIRINPGKKRLKIAIVIGLLLLVVVGILIWRGSVQNSAKVSEPAGEKETQSNESPTTGDAPTGPTATPVTPPAPSSQQIPPPDVPAPTRQEVDARRAARIDCKSRGGDWVYDTPDGKDGCRL